MAFVEMLAKKRHVTGLSGEGWDLERGRRALGISWP